MEKIRVGLIDRSSATRLGLRVTLEKEEEFEIVGETRWGMDSGTEALRLLERATPDVLVLGLPVADMKALELIPMLREKHPETPLLIFSHWPYLKVSRLLRAGANGVLLETDSLSLLSDAIQTVYRGETWISPKAQALDAANGHEAEISFTDKELQLLSLLAQGWSSQEIADELELGERTVRKYECEMKQKLGLDSRAKLISYALQQQTLSTDLTEALSN
ncbi:MAG: response regulator transcription factor [Anaerolineales bacterium]